MFDENLLAYQIHNHGFEINHINLSEKWFQVGGTTSGQSI